VSSGILMPSDGSVAYGSCDVDFYKNSVPAAHVTVELKCFPILHQYVSCPMVCPRLL
jgi:hypothetical protein